MVFDQRLEGEDGKASDCSDRNGRCARAVSPHRCDESVAAPWHGHDITMLVPIPAEHSTENGNILTEIIFFHHSVRPDCLHQGFFIQNHFAVLDHIEQRVKRFGRERPRKAVAR